jgi:hypothetical protein
MMSLKVERVIAVVLTLMLANGWAQGHNDTGNVLAVKGEISSITLGTSIEVRFAKAPKIRGLLWQRDEKGFILKVAKGADMIERPVAFDTVKSVKVVRPTHTPAAAWIAVGAIVTVVVIVVVIFAKIRGNS